MPERSNSTDRPFRFGVGLTTSTSRREWIDKCRQAEDYGYDVLGVADHLGMPAPFPALVLAAEVTSRPRLATALSNAGFYNPALLARDAATTDQLTDGRLELGVGTGYMKSEFDSAGLRWLTPGQRVDHLEHTAHELRRLFSDGGYRPRPAQDGGPPLWLGGRGDRTLAIAARYADIIGFTGFASGQDGTTGYLDTADHIAERIAYTRALLGDRAAEVEFNLLIWRVSITTDRRAEARRLEPLRSLAAQHLLQVPTVLLGTPSQIAEQLREHREALGITYLTVAEYNMHSLAPVIELLT